jgi:hypothetical protein
MHPPFGSTSSAQSRRSRSSRQWRAAPMRSVVAAGRGGAGQRQPQRGDADGNQLPRMTASCRSSRQRPRRQHYSAMSNQGRSRGRPVPAAQTSADIAAIRPAGCRSASAPGSTATGSQTVRRAGMRPAAAASASTVAPTRETRCGGTRLSTTSSAHRAASRVRDAAISTGYRNVHSGRQFRTHVSDRKSSLPPNGNRSACP